MTPEPAPEVVYGIEIPDPDAPRVKPLAEVHAGLKYVTPDDTLPHVSQPPAKRIVITPDDTLPHVSLPSVSRIEPMLDTGPNVLLNSAPRIEPIADDTPLHVSLPSAPRIEPITDDAPLHVSLPSAPRIETILDTEPSALLNSAPRIEPITDDTPPKALRPSDEVCRLPNGTAHIFTPCGPTGITEEQCFVRGCCFHAAELVGTPSCFYPISQSNNEMHADQLEDDGDRDEVEIEGEEDAHKAESPKEEDLKEDAPKEDAPNLALGTKHNGSAIEVLKSLAELSMLSSSKKPPSLDPADDVEASTILVCMAFSV